MEWRISFACHCMMPGPSRIAQSRTLRSLYGMMGKLRRVMIQPMFSRRKSMRRAVLSTIVSVCAVMLTVQAQQPQTVLQGVYAENQARRGQTIYKAQCALCHGEMLEGRLDSKSGVVVSPRGQPGTSDARYSLSEFQYYFYCSDARSRREENNTGRSSSRRWIQLDHLGKRHLFGMGSRGLCRCRSSRIRAADVDARPSMREWKTGSGERS